MIMRLALDLPEEESSTAIARHLSRSLLEHLDVAPEDVDDLEYVVGELSTNAVRHAGDVSYTLELEFYASCAVVTVRDRGRGFSFAGVPPPGTIRVDPDGRERSGGWGLLLVQRLADQVQCFRTDPHGTTVRAEKTLHYRSGAAERMAQRIEQAAGAA